MVSFHEIDVIIVILEEIRLKLTFYSLFRFYNNLMIGLVDLGEEILDIGIPELILPLGVDYTTIGFPEFDVDVERPSFQTLNLENSRGVCFLAINQVGILDDLPIGVLNAIVFGQVILTEDSKHFLLSSQKLLLQIKLIFLGIVILQDIFGVDYGKTTNPL